MEVCSSTRRLRSHKAHCADIDWEHRNDERDRATTVNDEWPVDAVHSARLAKLNVHVVSRLKTVGRRSCPKKVRAASDAKMNQSGIYPLLCRAKGRLFKLMCL
jgi:hypothetical protein